METFGVGIIGAGWVASEHIKAFQKNPHTEVRAISSRTAEGARKKAEDMGLLDCKVYDTTEELNESGDIDMVTICSPNYLHPEQTVMAAREKLHMIIEKPVAIDLEGLKKMRDAVRKAGVRTVVSFVLRWNPMVETLKDLISRDFFGEVFYAEADYLHNLEPTLPLYKWITARERGGTPILSGGGHAVDCIRWLSHPGMKGGAEIVEVKGFGAALRDDLDYQSSQVGIFKFKGGGMGKVAVSFDCAQPYMFPIHVFGTKGSIRNNQIYSETLKGQTDWASIPTVLPDEPDVSHHSFQGEIDHFVECVKEEKESFVNLEDAVNTHEACMAVDISIAEGRSVKLPLL